MINIRIGTNEELPMYKSFDSEDTHILLITDELGVVTAYGNSSMAEAALQAEAFLLGFRGAK